MRWELKRAIQRSGLLQKSICHHLCDRGFDVDPVHFSRIVHADIAEVPIPLQEAIASILSTEICLKKLFHVDA